LPEKRLTGAGSTWNPQNQQGVGSSPWGQTQSSTAAGGVWIHPQPGVPYGAWGSQPVAMQSSSYSTMQPIPMVFIYIYPFYRLSFFSFVCIILKYYYLNNNMFLLSAAGFVLVFNIII